MPERYYDYGRRLSSGPKKEKTHTIPSQKLRPRGESAEHVLVSFKFFCKCLGSEIELDEERKKMRIKNEVKSLGDERWINARKKSLQKKNKERNIKLFQFSIRNSNTTLTQKPEIPSFFFLHILYYILSMNFHFNASE